MTTMIRSPNAGRQDALARVSYPIVRLSRYGIATGSGAATTNRTAIQLAINDAIAAKTWLVNDLPDGTYDVAKAGTANPYFASSNYCLDFGDGTANFRFLSSNPKAILRVAASQMTGNTTYCDFFIGKDLKNCEFSGVFDGGALQQPGWTGGYGQDSSGGFLFYASTAGGGCQDIKFRDLDMRNFFGNPTKGPIGNGGLRSSGRFTLVDCQCSAVGEGWQVERANEVVATRCRVDNSAATMVGDCFEWSSCGTVTMDGCTTYSTRTGGMGSHVECYGTTSTTVKNSHFFGGNDPVGMGTSIFQSVKSVVFEGCSFTNLSIGYGPVYAGRLTFKGCSFDGCGTSTDPCLQSGALNGEGASPVGAVLEIDGGSFVGCGPILVTRNGTLVVKNRAVVANSLGNAFHLSRSDSSVPLVDLNVEVRNPVGYGLEITGGGTAWAPRGSVRGLFTGAVNQRQFVLSNSGSADDLIIDVDVPDVPPLSQWEMLGYKQFIDPNEDPGTSAADSGADYLRGSKGQILKLIGRAASRALAANTRMQYLGATSLTLTTKTTLVLEYIGNRIWRELERQVAA